MGRRYAEEYKQLAGDIFVRASSDGRVVESGEFFLQGFEGQNYSLTAKKPDVDLVRPTPPLDTIQQDPLAASYQNNLTNRYAVQVVYEGDGLNDTLSIGTCTTDENLAPAFGDEAEDNWLSVFAPPIAYRLNSALGTNVSGTDITNLLSLCSFDSLKGQDWVASPWCKVFTDAEFRQNEYYYDLSKF